MKKILLLVCCLSAICLNSCKDDFDDIQVQKSPKIKMNTYEQELEIIKNYMKIDTLNHQFNVTISDSIIEAERLTKENVVSILKNIAELNEKVESSIKKGEVTTLCLSNNKGLQTFTVNCKTNMSFVDTLEPLTTLKARASKGFPIMLFSDGNWVINDVTFQASDHVTSSFAVANCRGYWQVTFRCYTGTSAYGNTYNQYGTGSTNGGINRYWWYTGGGSSPFTWNFGSTAPIGGEANGQVGFIDTY